MTEDEDTLFWRQLCAEVKPLHPEKKNTEPSQEFRPPDIRHEPKPARDRLFGDSPTRPEVSAQDLLRPQYRNWQQKRQAFPIQDSPKTFTELDGRRDRRFRSGRITPDAVLDLHGLREHDAAEEFARFFARALRQKQRNLLVVTGKGSGVLHRALARWLENPGIRRHLAGVSAMPQHKGGSGAYGLYLRF